MLLLEWLATLLESLFPPWENVPLTHTCVRQRHLPLPLGVKQWLARYSWFPQRGVIVRDCGPGFTFRIPFIDTVDIIRTSIGADDLDNIECETRDGVVYDISPVLHWYCKNPAKAATQVDEFEASLKNEVRSVIVGYVNRCVGRLSKEELEQECSKLAASLQANWACHIARVTVNSMARPWQVYELRHSLEEANNRT